MIPHSPRCQGGVQNAELMVRHLSILQSRRNAGVSRGGARTGLQLLWLSILVAVSIRGCQYSWRGVPVAVGTRRRVGRTLSQRYTGHPPSMTPHMSRVWWPGSQQGARNPSAEIMPNQVAFAVAMCNLWLVQIGVPKCRGQLGGAKCCGHLCAAKLRCDHCLALIFSRRPWCTLFKSVHPWAPSMGTRRGNAAPEFHPFSFRVTDFGVHDQFHLLVHSWGR